jgi:parallel beta-helix repeat protein
VINSFATGSATGYDNIGGLIGYNYNTVINSFATGNATTTYGENVGGFIGNNDGETVNNNYYSGFPEDNSGAIHSSFVNFTSFTFISGSSGPNWNEDGNTTTTANDSSFIWKIIDCYTLPYFQWQDTPDPLAPYVETISPSSGANYTESSTSFWINITGCSFNISDPVFVNMTMAGQTPINGTIESNTYTTINATFDLTHAIEGDWSLYVINPDGQTSTAKAFTVEFLTIPSAPEGFINTTSDDWVNHSWNVDTSGTTDSYNISIGESWENGTTNNYYNHTGLSAHAWSNITVYAYNATGSTLSDGIIDNVQIPNNAVIISDIADITVTEGDNIVFDVNSTDVDGDSPTFACNRTDLFSDFNTNTGECSWNTYPSDAGTYSVEFNVSDGYGSVNSEIITITVNVYSLSTPVLSNTTGNFYVNWSWNPVSNADSYNVSLNDVWYNGTITTENNDSSMDYHATSEIQVLAYNETYGVLSGAVSDSVTLANNPISITNLNDINVEESELIVINANFDDLDEDTATFACNRTDLFTDFNTTTGEGTWQTNYTNSGTYSVNFSVNDGHGSTDSQVVTITVTNIPTTLYVGSGYDYTTIQGAVDDANNGDTIIVGDGIYNENVDVDKSVILRSENGSTKTAVTAKYSETSVFYISTDNVTINGFNVTGTTSTTAGIYLYSSNNHTIINNDVSGNYYGIVLGSSQNNKLTNNKVNSNDMYGIALGGSNNNTLINNNISNTSNNHGIYLLGSDYNILTSNTVCDNDAYGICIEDSSNNTLSDNNANNNGYDGIYLYDSADYNTLTDNTVKGNTESGIYLSGSSNTIVTDNILYENEENGIYLDGFSTNNTLENNVANSNFYYGIWLISSDNVLTSNTATNNSLYDIVTDDPNEINNLKVTDNGARFSFLSDDIQTGIKGNVTNSTSLSGKTNVNGYLTIKRGGVVVKSADVGVTREDPTLDITISYDDSGMSSSGESSIDLYKYNTSTWIAVSGTSLDTSSNQVTATLSEGTFGLFKDPETSSSSSSSSDGGSVATRVRSEGTISTLQTNSNGEVTGDTVVKSKDTITTLTLYKGTVGTDASGNPVKKIIVTTPASMPADTPKEVLESGLYYDFGPSGTTFSQDVLITIDFNPEEYEGKSPVIYTYSEENGWVALETTVDWENGRATAYTNHFSLYALFGDEEQEIVEETSEVTAEFSESVEENTETPTEDEGGFGYIYLILGIVVITVVGYIVVKNQKGEGGL